MFESLNAFVLEALHEGFERVHLAAVTVMHVPCNLPIYEVTIDARRRV